MNIFIVRDEKEIFNCYESSLEAVRIKEMLNDSADDDFKYYIEEVELIE